MGMPPIKGVKFSRAVITVRPLPLELISSSKKRVGFLNMTAVFALPMEMLAPAEKVPSNRSSAIRLPPSSTTAITPPGACRFCASAFAAAMTCSAPCKVSVFFSTVCATAKLAMERTIATNPHIESICSEYSWLFASLMLEGRDVQVRICSRPSVDGCYMTGELKLASPRFASAQAHQMITLETFFT